MKVFNVVPDRWPFIEGQINSLEELGVDLTTVVAPNEKPRTLIDYIGFYSRILKKSFDQYDLVHGNYGLTAPLILSQPNRPLVLTLWGRDIHLFRGENRWGWFGKNCTKLEYFDEIIVRNKKMKDMVGLNAHIIPSGVDIKKFKPIDKQEAQKKVGWSPNIKHVLFPYPPSREVKNYPLAKSVIEKVKKRVDFKVELAVVYGVPHNKVPLYINASDLMLLTSHTEGSPNSVKEAISCNIPVVANDVGDVENLLDGVRYSKVGNNENELVEGVIKALEKNKTSNGRKRIKELNLSWEQIGKRILNVYEMAIG